MSVIFCLVPNVPDATIRHHGFMLSGLSEVETELRTMGIPFHCLSAAPVNGVPAFVTAHEACAVVADFSPLREDVAYKSAVCAALPSHVPLYELDTHNVVPVWVASDKLEVGCCCLLALACPGPAPWVRGSEPWVMGLGLGLLNFPQYCIELLICSWWFFC